MVSVIRVLGRRADRLEPVGFVGRSGGPGYVESPATARTFSEPAAREYVESVRADHPGIALEVCPLSTSREIPEPW